MKIILYSEDPPFTERFAWLLNQAGLPELQLDVCHSHAEPDADTKQADIHFFHNPNLTADSRLAGSSQHSEARIFVLMDKGNADLDRVCEIVDADDVLAVDELTPALLRSVLRQTQRTERYLKSLKNEVNRYRGFFEWSKDCLFHLETTASGDFRYTEMNPAGLSCVGLSVEQVRGRTPTELLGPEAGGHVVQALSLARDSRSPYRFSVTLNYGRDDRSYDATYVPFLNGEGEVEGIAGCARDVTELQQTRLRVNELETLHSVLRAKSRNDAPFAALVAASADAIVSYNKEAQVATWNPGAENSLVILPEKRSGKARWNSLSLRLASVNTKRCVPQFIRVKRSSRTPGGAIKMER